MEIHECKTGDCSIRRRREEIGGMIEMIQELIDKGHAYEQRTEPCISEHGVLQGLRKALHTRIWTT